MQTKPGGLLVNLASYGEWRASPMGLAGRAPIFFSQFETERTVHAPQEKVIQDLCLHCHGVMGQRQFCMDQLGKDSQRCSNTERLYAMAGYLQLDGTQAAHWKLALVSSGVVSLTK